ncbi:hypothetical protein ACFE04_015258 [Oxalis oulophora]
MRGLFSLTSFYRVTNTRNPVVVTLSLRRFSAVSDENSLAGASYLRDKCGLSADSALLAAKHSKFQNSERADEVLSFFRNIGFSNSQLSRLVRALPVLLAYPDPLNIFKPKIDFLLSKGISSANLIKGLTVNPLILSVSLKHTITPHFNYFQTLLGSDYAAINIFTRYPDILIHKPQSYVEPNMTTLRQVGVPESRILTLLCEQPRVLITKPDRFKSVVEEVRSIGVIPKKFSFIMAVNVKISISKSTWEKKLGIFRKWGWSDEDILQAFMRFPLFLKISEDKVNSGMDIFVNKLGWEPSKIAKFPCLLGYSLMKRNVPRSEVIGVLLTKGLINKSAVTYKVFSDTEIMFLQKFVNPYQNEVPELLKLYQKYVGVLSF